MDTRRIAAIALRVGDFDHFEQKMAEARLRLEQAASLGAELAVLPESINIYCGDGPGNPKAMTIDEVAFDSLEPVGGLLSQACDLHMALAFGLFLREDGALRNVMLFYDQDGQYRGRYVKRNPTSQEMAAGVIPGADDQELINWNGIKVGGAICFDTNFDEVFTSQAAAGAKLMLVPSLWDGGRWLPQTAVRNGIAMAVSYGAWSRIINFDGTVLDASGYREESVGFGNSLPLAVASVNFDFATFHMCGNAAKIPAILSRYGKHLLYKSDTENSVFYLASLSHDFTIVDIIAEFGLVKFSDFFSAYRLEKKEILEKALAK